MAMDRAKKSGGEYRPKDARPTGTRGYGVTQGGNGMGANRGNPKGISPRKPPAVFTPGKPKPGQPLPPGMAYAKGTGKCKSCGKSKSSCKC